MKHNLHTLQLDQILFLLFFIKIHSQSLIYDIFIIYDKFHQYVLTKVKEKLNYIVITMHSKWTKLPH